MMIDPPSLSPAVDLPKRPKVSPDHGRLALQVAEELKAMILGGDLKPGDRLPTEAELCDYFEVSRLTMREALQMLRAFGLLEATRGRGTFVREPDPDSLLRDLAYFSFDNAAAVEDLFDVRALLETQAARGAARHSKSSEDRRLRELAEEGQSVLLTTPMNFQRLGELDAKFHLAIAAVSGNLVLEQLMHRLMLLLEPVRERSLAVPGQAATSTQQHLSIAEAIARSDPELAAARVVEHLRGVTDVLTSQD